MKKVLSMLLAFVVVIALAVTMVACTPASDLTTVRIAIHRNEAASNVALGLEKGIFEKWGINLEVTQVENGVAEMTALRADKRTLDIGYIGAGVAWNAIDGNGNGAQFVFFENLGNSEHLMARKGLFTDTNSNGTFEKEEVFAGLKGKTVYLQTGATPGNYFKSLVNWLNEGVDATDQIWIFTEASDYLADYTAPNSTEANKVTVVNMENDKIPAAMATSASEKIDVAVAYSPATKTIYTTNSDIEKIADWSVLTGQASVGTYVASTKWLEENPEVAQNLINALYEVAIYRGASREHGQEAITAAENLCGVTAGSYNLDATIFWSQAQYEEGFANESGQGYSYMEYLYNTSKGNVPAGNTVKSFEESFNDTYLLKAIEHFKKA